MILIEPKILQKPCQRPDNLISNITRSYNQARCCAIENLLHCFILQPYFKVSFLIIGVIGRLSLIICDVLIGLIGCLIGLIGGLIGCLIGCLIGLIGGLIGCLIGLIGCLIGLIGVVGNKGYIHKVIHIICCHLCTRLGADIQEIPYTPQEQIRHRKIHEDTGMELTILKHIHADLFILGADEQHISTAFQVRNMLRKVFVDTLFDRQPISGGFKDVELHAIGVGYLEVA
jgi:hypothetical protein